MCTFLDARSNRNEFITKQKKNFTTNVSKCPLCKAPIGTGAAIHVNIAPDDIIGNFDVNCKSSGCLWTGQFQDSSASTNNTSKYVRKFLMQCANEGYREVVAREGMVAHISQSAKRKEGAPGMFRRACCFPLLVRELSVH